MSISILDDLKIYLRQIFDTYWSDFLWAVFWMIIVALPLKLIRRQDAATGATYVLFCIMAGMLLITIPAYFQQKSYSVHFFVTCFGIFTVTSFSRFYEPEPKKLELQADLEASNAKRD